MDSTQEIIGNVLLRSIPFETGKARITCNLAVRYQPFCSTCNRQLSEKTIQVLEIHDSADDSEKTIVASCPECMDDHLKLVAKNPAVLEQGTKLLILVNWKGTTRVKDIVGVGQ